MEKLMDKYMNVYNRGSHCASTSLMNLCRYYDFNISESMCFGLGQALGFSFYKDTNMNLYSFSGRARDIIRNFFNATGISFENYSCMNNNEVWKFLQKKVVEEYKPVLVKLDMDSMQYLKNYFQFEQKMEQSEHVAVIIGIEGEYVTISEYFQKEPIVVSKNELLEGMNKKFEHKSIFNTLYIINEMPNDIELPSCIWLAILNNVHNMLFGFGSNLGIPGLKKFSHDIEIIRKKSTEKEFRNFMLMINGSAEKIGTGGGNFRRLYARFLKESSRITNCLQLDDIGNRYASLSLLWKQFAQLSESIYRSENGWGQEYEQLLYLLEQITSEEIDRANELMLCCKENFSLGGIL